MEGTEAEALKTARGLQQPQNRAPFVGVQADAWVEADEDEIESSRVVIGFRTATASTAISSSPAPTDDGTTD